MLRTALLAATPIVAALVLGGCATPSTPGGQPPSGIAAEGEVIGQGTVLQVDEAAPMFCLGGVLESYPPQCDGPEIVGWDWDSVDGAETASRVTWGAYALQGTWDGERFTLTQPAMLLALYDPMPIVDPYEDPANAGTNEESRLLEVQAELNTADPSLRPLESGPRNGYLFATWIYDDGDLQRYVDNRFGPDVVHVVSALRPVEGG
ncbi:hypothetical protein GCM10022239_17600 [Leifsonia bigeumensis]|uniref:Uncharacterized protein n=1 Tax=Leifsonella bigeumensis TaxID=433643 RepID=A0ABP7FRL2_9MICO